MGFSHERGAAVRTILRARAIGGQQAIEDAETAVSGFLDMEDFDEYAGYHAPEGLTTDDPVIELLHERDHFKNAAITNESDILDILAKALGYDLYKPGEPGYSPDRDNYVTGDHTAASLALEAARRISEMENILDEEGL
jgi:hypothetical protein